MTDAKHSPTLNYKLPLRAIEMPGCMKYELLDAEDQRVAILPDWQKDLAELIVRSVNSLPELVRNAKAVLARYDEGEVIINPKIPNYAYSLTVHGCQVDMQSLREALAAAGVKP